MKKKFWILISIVVVLTAVFFIIKTQTTWLGAEQTPAEQWLASQTGNIFTVENLPYIQELTQKPSSKLVQYIKDYMSSMGPLAQLNETCPKTNDVFFTGGNLVCFKNMPILYNTGFGNVGTGELNHPSLFIDNFNKILSSIGYMSLTSLISGDMVMQYSIDAYFNANPKTFQVLNDQYARDDKEVFFYQADKSNIYPIMGGDSNSFQPLSIDGYFTAKDKNYVYHRDVPNTGIDVNSFQTINKEYAKDKNNVYLYNAPITGMDINSFQAMSGGYAKDKNNVYLGLDKLSGADSKTFIVVMNGSQLIGKDKKQVYIDGLSSQEYAQNQQEDQITPDNVNELTGEAYRIQNKLPKIPDFTISIQVNPGGTVKASDKDIVLHATIFNIGGVAVSLSKSKSLRLHCAGNPEGAYADSYLFNVSKDITSIPGGKTLQANESFSIDIQAPLDTGVLADFQKYKGNCFLYNDSIKEINSQNNGASFSLSVIK